MPKRPRDVNSLGKQIVDEATSESEPPQQASTSSTTTSLGLTRRSATRIRPPRQWRQA